MSDPPLTTRRKYLKYLGAAAIAAGAAALGAYEFGDYLGKQTTTSSATSTVAPTTSTLPASTTSTPMLNPVVGYALEKGIDPEVATKLAILRDLNSNNATLVDYLSLVNGLESQRELAQSLQLKVLYGDANGSGILSDRRVTDQETVALRYLSALDVETQKAYILFGLDEDVSNYLAMISSFTDHDFGRFAVKNTLCMRTHHKLTNTEATYLTRLDESYSSYPELVEELTRLPDLVDVDERDLAAVDAILLLVEESKRGTPYKRAFQSMLAEGIRDSRRYCSPLEGLLWIGYDQDFQRTNPLKSYSLKTLINAAWKQTSTSRNYRSERWQVFDEVVDRLNSPDLVSTYMSSNIRYEDDPQNINQRAFETFNKKAGDCEDHAMLALYCLHANGYGYDVEGPDNTAVGLDVQWGRIGSRNALGHAVCLYKEDGLFYYLDNTGFKSGFKRGPFNSPEDAVEDVRTTWKRYAFFDVYFRIIKEVFA